MRVLLADDQKRVRSALRLLLEQEPEVVVVAEAAESDGLLAQAQATQPDLLLLDWELPGWPAADLLDGLHLLCPDLKVIALSGLPESRHTALRAGVDAFVSKGDPPERLLDALYAICRNGATRNV